MRIPKNVHVQWKNFILSYFRVDVPDATTELLDNLNKLSNTTALFKTFVALTLIAPAGVHKGQTFFYLPVT